MLFLVIMCMLTCTFWIVTAFKGALDFCVGGVWVWVCVCVVGVVVVVCVCVCIEKVKIQVKYIKGVLHPRLVFGLFLHFSQKLQHIGNK